MFVGLPIFWGEDQRLRVSATTLFQRFDINPDMRVNHRGRSFYGPISTQSGEILVTLGDACGILWKHQNHPQSLYQQFCEELESLYTTTNTTPDLHNLLAQALHTAGGLESIARVFAT